MWRLSIALLVLGVIPCYAQQGATAELSGSVVSAGQPLSGVTVTLSSVSLQGNRVTSTGNNGGYLFALLPPADYRLRFDLQGFTTVEKRVRIPLAGSIRVDAELSPEPLHEAMVVESDSMSRTPNGSMSTNLRASELQRLPGGRDIRAGLLLSPNTNAQGPRNALIIAGAPSWDSLFLVDGVVVNENLRGQPHNLFIEDAIQEIAVFTGEVSAEYGRFTGGVVSTITKSGGNELSGSLRDTLTNGAWTRRTPWPDQPDSLDKMNHAAEATLGGFLLKDRLWFFSAARQAVNTLGSFTFSTNIPYQAGSRDARREGKLTFRIAPSHSMIATFVDSSLAETNAIDSRGSRALDVSSLIPKRRQLTDLLALTYEGVFAPNTFAEIRGSKKGYSLRGNGGQSADRILGTLVFVRGVGATLNAPLGCGVCGDDQRNSNSWAAKASHYSNTPWGNHTTVGGIEEYGQERINNGTRSASEFNIQTGSAQIVVPNAFPHFDATTLIDWTSPFAGSSRSKLNTRSAYLDDRWDLSSRASIDLGVRYDRNGTRSVDGQIISNDASFSPRLTAILDLRNDGRHRLIAGYGRYVAKLFDEGGSPQQVGTFTELGWRYHGPEINALGTPADQLLSTAEALPRLFAWFYSVGGVDNRQYLSFITDPRYDIVFPRSLKSSAVDERSLGYAIQMHEGYLRADYMARDWHHFYAARVDRTTGQTNLFGKNLDVAWIINDDSETVRSYRAIQLQGSWRRRRASAGGAYTWSKLRGNDEAEEGTILAPRNLPLALWYPEFLGYPHRRPIGYLRQDQRHRARVWVGYEAALRRGSLSAFVLQWFDSGRAYSAVADIDPSGLTVPYEGMPANPGYAGNQIATGPYFFSARGAFRTDDVFSTDLALNYEIPLRDVRLFLKGDVLNVFDNAAVVSPGTEVMTRFRSGATSGLQPFNPFTQVPVEGVHYRLSPTFGKPTGPDSYQTPRTFQLSVGARF